MNKPFDAREATEFLVSQYLDGTLDNEAVRDFEARLKVDVELRELLEHYGAVDGHVRDWADRSPEVDLSRFATRVRGRIDGDEASRRRSRLVLRFFTPLAAAASIVFTFSLLHQSPAPVEPADAWLVQYAPPAGVDQQEYEAVVSYTVRPEDAGDVHDEPRGPTVVLAVAAVGSRVGWPEWNASVGVN